MSVEVGDIVKVEYTGTLDDGSMFDCSDGAPLEFEVGSGSVIKGFDDAVVGMEVGDEKDVRIEPDEAYGERTDNLMKAIPRKLVPEDQELSEGMMVAMDLVDGSRVPAVISKITDDSIELDFNHPLAGKALNFKIKIIDCNKKIGG